MWPLFALGVSLLASFKPVVLTRVLRTASPVATSWAVSFLSLPLLSGLSLARPGDPPPPAARAATNAPNHSPDPPIRHVS